MLVRGLMPAESLNLRYYATKYALEGGTLASPVSGRSKLNCWFQM